MLRRYSKLVVAMAVIGLLVLAASPAGQGAWFHLAPLRWTGEAERLAAAIGLKPGSTVADIGAGDGALIVELAHLIADGTAIATEMSADKRERIAERAQRAGARVVVRPADATATGLEPASCDAVTMRMVLHHVADRAAFAADIRRALKPGGRVAIVDFAGGALPHLGEDHGVSSDDVRASFESAGFILERSDDSWGGGTFLLVFRKD